MSARTFAIFVSVLAVIGLLAYGVLTKGNEAIGLGEPVPDVELPQLDGTGTGSLADYRGKWVLVNVWASWCEPCRAESPALQGPHDSYRGDPYVVLGINSEDNRPDALEFVRELDLTYPQLHDPSGDRPEALGMTGFPESFLVDPQGNLALHRAGPVDEAYLRDVVAPTIDGREP